MGTWGAESVAYFHLCSKFEFIEYIFCKDCHIKLNFLSTEYTRKWRSHLNIFESKQECALKFICSKNCELFTA